MRRGQGWEYRCDSFFKGDGYVAVMGHLFNTGKAPAQKEDVKSPEVIDTNETADSAVRARRRKRYGAEQTFTAKGAGTFGQGSGSAGSNFRKTLG